MRVSIPSHIWNRDREPSQVAIAPTMMRSSGVARKPRTSVHGNDDAAFAPGDARRGDVAGRRLRRRVRDRGEHDWDLLPPVVLGQEAAAGPRGLLSHRARGADRRLSPLPTL